MIQEFYGANGVCLIEWPIRLEPYGYYPAEFLGIDITAPDPDRADLRELSFSAAGEVHTQLAERLAQKLNL
jgi:hypothetical protein